jgi:tetratricopeptide (TPR) repeat protein
MLELKRLEIHLLMQTASFTPPDLCPPHEYFHAVKLTPSYPIVLSGHSWEVAIRHITDLFNAVDVSSIETRSPEAALALFELSQTLEDLGMHHYSHTVATWAVFLRRRLYNSDKEMHRRDLASTLCLKARVLAGLGRTNGSLIAASEAVKLCYEDQALQGVQLAKALLVQAPLLNAVERKSEAKVVAREALSILGTLGEDKPQLKHFLSLARASLSNLLLDMEEPDEALAVVQDAIKSARSLIGFTDPRPAHSNALLIKAKIQTARGEKGSAYVTVVQAIRHLRSLTTERPAFTAFLAYALVLSSRYLQVAGFYWEARKSAEESVELHRTLHTSAPRAFAAHYAEAVGQLVRLRSTDDVPETEVFDMAQHAAGLFREASVRDSEGLAGALLVIANSLFEASRPQDAAAPAEEAVEILRPRWKRNAEEYAVRFVLALRLAAACRPDSEAGLEFAKEAVEAHRPRKDMTRDVHEELLTHLLMDVFSRLRQLGREVEAIPWKTEAARLNPDVVEVIDPPPVAGASTEYPKSLPGGMGEYGSGSDDDELEDN